MCRRAGRRGSIRWRRCEGRDASFSVPSPNPIVNRWIVSLVLGVVLFGLGVFVALRPLWTHNGMVTGTRWLDMAFAVVFILRGAINVRSALAKRASRPG
jgi:hypothetical protein